ncbi:phage tail protein [Pseudomonas sp.]|uniref:phage tail protein n=1 Tax=Pseudomonas sp. TaxID=306 RepID=UPI003CC57D91
MPWYRSGTVSVTLNSTTVTGTGTAFAANSRVGDAFLGPDGRWYEVANVASDTVLSILPAYQGATAAAGTYALAPMQGYVKASADQLRTIVNSFGDKLAALGTTGNYDTLPVNKGGTGLTALADAIQSLLGAADQGAARAAIGALAKAGDTMSGALNEAAPATLASSATVAIGAAAANTVTISGSVTITAFDVIAAGARRTLIFAANLTLTQDATRLILPGAASIVTAAGDVAEMESLGGGNWKCLGFFRAAELPDLVRSVAQGGTGVTSMAALLAALNAVGNYSKTNILGTVSQTSGVPTGAIIESGTNANGSYTKFADGTMICEKTFTTGVVNLAAGSLFTSAQVSGGSWAANFIAQPYVAAQGTVTSSGGGWPSCYAFPSATAAGNWAVYNHATSTSGGTVYLVAVGRWF